MEKTRVMKDLRIGASLCRSFSWLPDRFPLVGSVPREIVEAKGWGEKTKLEFVLEADGRVVLRAIK